MVILHNYLKLSEGSWGIISHYEFWLKNPIVLSHENTIRSHRSCGFLVYDMYDVSEACCLSKRTAAVKNCELLAPSPGRYRTKNDSQMSQENPQRGYFTTN